MQRDTLIIAGKPLALGAVRRRMLVSGVMPRRWKIAVFALLIAIVAGGVATIAFLRYRQPPLAVRLLPGNAEAYIYVDLRPIRAVADLKPGTLVQDDDVAAFSRETGITPEHDLEEAAIGVLPAEPVRSGAPGSGAPASGAPASGAPERRFAEIFAGNLDAGKLADFLRKRATTVDRYDGLEIFVIPREERIVRVSILDGRTVAVTNSTAADPIQRIIDRFHRRQPARAPDFVRRNFDHVPLGAIAWAIVRMNSDPQHGVLPLPGDINVKLPYNTEVTASARVLSSLELRAEARLKDEDAAEKLSNEISTYLTLFKAVQISVGTQGADADVKQLFDDLKLERNRERVSVSAEVPLRFLQKLASQATQSAKPEREAAGAQKK
jgi:hypothetical protein